MRVLVCGGRDFENFTAVDNRLEKLDREGLVIIHGDAKGADTLAGDWAHMNYISCWKFPANWPKYPKAAGPIRNKQMLDEGKPDLVIAFPGSKGTAHMIKIAKEAGIPVEMIEI